MPTSNGKTKTATGITTRPSKTRRMPIGLLSGDQKQDRLAGGRLNDVRTQKKDLNDAKMSQHTINLMRIIKCIFIGLASSCTLLHSSALAWTVEGKWSTAQFNCTGIPVKIGVDMNSRIGGGDASPVRNAYMNVNGRTMGAAWMVGASMNSIETNNRDYALVMGNSTHLRSIGEKNKNCIPVK